jgi:hypothetical protein
MHKIVKLLIVVLALISFTQAKAALPDTIYRVGATETPGIAWEVFLQGDYAYIADFGRITVVDKSVPTSPWVRSSLNSGPPVFSIGIFVRDTVAYLNPGGWSISFPTVSISNPDSMYVLDWINLSSTGDLTRSGVVTVDTITYIASGTNGFMMIDVSSPTSIDTIRSYNTPGNALDLFVRDSLVYIADFDSLQIVNVSDPTSPFRIGAVNVPTGCYGIDVVGNFAYLACQSTSGSDGSLLIIDISNPSSPQILGSINNINGDPIDVDVQGIYAYVSSSDHSLPTVEGGVRIVDISDSLNPILIASYDTPGDPRGIFAVFPYIYVADYDSLQILRHIKVGVEEELKSNIQPKLTRLSQNKPNPFINSTILEYKLSSRSTVSLKIFDVAGRLIQSLVHEDQLPGLYRVTWDGRNGVGQEVVSGVYFYQLRTDSSNITKKLIKLGFRLSNHGGNQYV